MTSLLLFDPAEPKGFSNHGGKGFSAFSGSVFVPQSFNWTNGANLAFTADFGLRKSNFASGETFPKKTQNMDFFRVREKVVSLR